MTCRHKWWKPGKFFAVNPPKYVILCKCCKSTAYYTRGRGIHGVEQFEESEFDYLVKIYSDIVEKRKMTVNEHT